MKISFASISKNVIFLKKTELLGYKFTQTVISPLESRIAAILTTPTPTYTYTIKIDLASVHYISKIIPYLAKLCHPSEFYSKIVHR